LERMRIFGTGSQAERTFIVLILVLVLLGPEASVCGAKQIAEADKQNILRGVGRNWIQVGARQCQRRQYEASDRSLTNAREYKQYLSESDLKAIEEVEAKIRVAKLRQKQITEHIAMADDLILQGETVRAKAHIEKALGSDFLTKAQIVFLTAKLEKVNKKLVQQKKDVVIVYNRSVDYFNAGEYEKARDGFAEVASNGLLTAPAGETAEDYLAKIEQIFVAGEKSSAPVTIANPMEQMSRNEASAISRQLYEVSSWVPVQQRPEAAVHSQKTEDASVADAHKITKITGAEPAAEDTSSYIKSVSQKVSILRSYTKAIVSNTETKVTKFISQGEFEQAEKAVMAAEDVVIEHRLHLGNELFKEYIARIQKMSEDIIREETRWFSDWQKR